MNSLTHMAAEAASGNIFQALGIDWKMLIFQIISFVILVWLLGKFVYPVLIKTVDGRRAEIEASMKAAEQAEKKADAAKDEIKALLQTARIEAGEIVTTAREEAASTLAAADEKAKVHADTVIKTAHDQIEKDIVHAKKALQNETLQLVALATEKVASKAVAQSADETLITSALSEAK